MYLIQTEQYVAALPRVQVGANWREAHCRLILDGFKIKLCSSSKISPRGKKPTRHVECWASSTENFQLEIRKMWLWRWLWVVVRTSSIRVTIVEVGGKRTIKYQNTSYGIDMQMLRAAPTDFAHAHLDGHLSIGHRGSKQVLADAAIIVGRATAAVLTILFAREETWDVNWAPHTSHKSQSNLLACSTRKLLFGGVYTISLAAGAAAATPFRAKETHLGCSSWIWRHLSDCWVLLMLLLLSFYAFKARWLLVGWKLRPAVVDSI